MGDRPRNRIHDILQIHADARLPEASRHQVLRLELCTSLHGMRRTGPDLHSRGHHHPVIVGLLHAVALTKGAHHVEVVLPVPHLSRAESLTAAPVGRDLSIEERPCRLCGARKSTLDFCVQLSELMQGHTAGSPRLEPIHSRTKLRLGIFNRCEEPLVDVTGPRSGPHMATI